MTHRQTAMASATTAALICAVAIAFNLHDIIAMCKYATGSAELISASIPIAVDINGKTVSARLYPLLENKLATAEGNEIRSPCYLLIVKDPIKLPPLKIGSNWVGMCSYGGENVTTWDNKLIITKLAMKSFDIDDIAKGQGDKYIISNVNGCQTYDISLKDIGSVKFHLTEKTFAFISNMPSKSEQSLKRPVTKENN